MREEIGIDEIEQLEQYLSRLIDEGAWREYESAMVAIQEMWARLKPAFVEKYSADMNRLISN
jgi:hypothetical protein